MRINVKTYSVLFNRVKIDVKIRKATSEKAKLLLSLNYPVGFESHSSRVGKSSHGKNEKWGR